MLTGKIPSLGCPQGQQLPCWFTYLITTESEVTSTALLLNENYILGHVWALETRATVQAAAGKLLTRLMKAHCTIPYSSQP